MLSLNTRAKNRFYSLGPLEWQIMGILWQSKSCCVKDVVARLPQPRAYTTIMTTMARMFQKGLLSRKWTDGKFFYKACTTHQDLEKAHVDKLVTELLAVQTNSQAPESVMLYVLEGLSEHNAKGLGEAMATIRITPRRTRCT